ncbi:unnamed protein product [Blepharisma stoltei]|uniref:Uncharacterized protein n=1 Tax=Blepharisma stoltei TaxID=1481888 RepID=A0AAU9KA74_9CILI|nr:unnamed protein product [Blepharisma stoltei]
MDVFISVFKETKCYSCNSKVSMTKKRRKCVKCEHLFCTSCSIKVKAPDLGFLRHRRYCLQCHSHLTSSLTSEFHEEIKQDLVKAQTSPQLNDHEAHSELESIAKSAGFTSEELTLDKKLIKNAFGLLLNGIKPQASRNRANGIFPQKHNITEDNPLNFYAIIRNLTIEDDNALYQVRELNSETIAILKKVKPENSEEFSEICEEISLTKAKKHPNILQYYDAFHFNDHIWYAIESIDVTMYELAADRAGYIPEKHMAYICKEILQGLAFLHKEGRVHRDVKSDNILLSPRGDIKLGDFGLAAQLCKSCFRRQLTADNPSWMAPELARHTNYNEKIDIWSFGIFLIELAEGQPPYINENPMKILYNISAKPPPTFQNKLRWSSEIKEFLGFCLRKNPEERMSAEELLRHPFIEEHIEETSKEQFAEYLEDFYPSLSKK